MDRNSAIGLAIIAVLILLYLNFLSPTPKVEESRPAQIVATDTTRKKQETIQPTGKPDSSLIRQYGQLSSHLTGTEETIKVENSNLSISFSSTGTIKEVELKNFKTYTQKALYLVTPSTNQFSLKTQYEGKEIDLYRLYYQYQNEKRGDTTIVHFTANVSENAFLRHTYTIPSSGYQIGYQLTTNGIPGLTGDQLHYQWNERILLQEKDMADSRNRTTINYYTAAGDFEDLSEASKSIETEAFVNPVKWVAIRQKFFVGSLIAQNTFSGGEVTTSVDETNPEIVKDATVKLFIPKQDITSGKAKFSYYFGPNDYEIIKNVTPGFSRNLSLGWPPVIWVNKFLILPIFKFLEQFIGNYGIIIVILVLIIKLILSPLSYKSYIGMAKMKLLKPELDVIKEKYGDNMTQIQAEQMKLYQQVGVSPFSGCIPLILQMPILFAMFYFFPVSIELRQKAFLWADDLSTYDSIATLPFSIPFYGSHVSLFVLLMTISTIISTWQNNQVSSVQGPMKSMSYIMPVIFMFVLNSFSAALSFYYFVSNLVTFAQQAIIKRFVDDTKIKAVMDDHRKKMESGGGSGTKSKFMSKLQDAMKASEEARKKSKK
jgi:YidC/Oxa1 family membrane protein insertase